MVETKRVKKRPIEVEAVQYTGGYVNGTEIAQWVNSNGGHAEWMPAIPLESYLEVEDETAELIKEHIAVLTLEGRMRCNVNWWIVKGIQGEFYPVAPDIFDESYDIIT